MGHFKVGDVVCGIPNNGYSVTSEQMRKGVVVETFNANKTMNVKILDCIHRDPGAFYRVYNDTNYFKLVGHCPNIEHIDKSVKSLLEDFRPLQLTMTDIQILF